MFFVALLMPIPSYFKLPYQLNEFIWLFISFLLNGIWFISNILIGFSCSRFIGSGNSSLSSNHLFRALIPSSHCPPIPSSHHLLSSPPLVTSSLSPLHLIFHVIVSSMPSFFVRYPISSIWSFLLPFQFLFFSNCFGFSHLLSYQLLLDG